MIKDLNKGITKIEYNSLNLPKLMDIKSPLAEARKEYTYTASGAKLRVVSKWNPNFSTNPVIGSDVVPTTLTKTKTTDYVGNIVYEDNALKRILVDGGYIEGGLYNFYLTDHLGNNRAVAKADASIIQRTQFYPFGAAFADGLSSGLQPYKYNGKELDAEHGVNWYDYSARQKSDFGFTSVDPLAEKFYSSSPYVYCYNNPLRYIDPDGKRGRPARSAAVRPTPTRYQNNIRYANAYPNGIRPTSTARTSTVTYTRIPTMQESPALIENYTNPNGNTVQVSINNALGRKLSLRVEFMGIQMEKIEKTINTVNGIKKELENNVKLTDNGANAQLNAMESVYQKQFDTKLNALNSSTLKENTAANAGYNFNQEMDNVQAVRAEIGLSPKAQVLNYIMNNLDKFTKNTTINFSEIPEWREKD